MEKISVIMIVMNEEMMLGEALKSVSWADEIIVVDSESKDRTTDIAKRYTNKVFVHPWEGFANQKKYALSLASNEWILNIDADERVSEKLKNEIAGLDFNSADGFKFHRENYLLNKHITTCGWDNDYQLRLFRKSKTRITDRLVHEGFEVNGAVLKLQSNLIHLTFLSIEKTISKINSYSSLEAEEKLRNKKNVKGSTIILHGLSAFLRDFLSLKGYKDGVHGLVIALISGMTTLLVYMKIWEHQISGNKESK